jgi:cobalt-zinc-cadmium efflux system outer membrane protein
MFSRFAQGLALVWIWMGLAGCTNFAVREQIDQAVCDRATQLIDLEPATPADIPKPKRIDQTSATPAAQEATIQAVEAREPNQAKPEQPKDQKKDKFQPRRLQMPADVPGAEAPSFVYPKDATDGQKAEYRRKFFAPLPPLGKEPEPLPGPNGKPFALFDLQRLARANNPDIARAVANVRAMEGVAIQAGLHPNPNFGYAADTIGNAGTAGFQGVFFEQMIKTAGKLELARQVASVDVVNARVALRAAENDVATRVRNGYFGVLVAQENVRVNRAIVQFTEDVYQAGLDLLRYGFAVPYEPMQLRSQVFIARSALVSARNSYQTAWRQLASAVGLPGLPPTQLAGRIDAPLPVFRYDEVRDRVLTRHTDVLTALNDILRARLNLRLARITPIPDADLQLKLEKDYTAAPHLLTSSIQMTVGVPIFDRNQGNIIQAEAVLSSAEQEPHKARDDLLARLADAFGRYETNRVQIEYFRDRILPDQVRGYKGLFDRYHVDSLPRAGGVLPVPVTSPPPTFQDLVTAQQSLIMTIQTYLSTLGAMWTAVVDVANLLQTEDLFQVSERVDVPPIPELPPLPCCHPCSPLRDPALYGRDAPWPPAAPEEQKPGVAPDSKAPAPKPDAVIPRDQ